MLSLQADDGRSSTVSICRRVTAYSGTADAMNSRAVGIRMGSHRTATHRAADHGTRPASCHQGDISDFGRGDRLIGARVA